MVGGGSLSRRPGTLSGDGKLLLCPCGQLVSIYSAVTGQRVGLLVGHTEEVTCVILDPENDNQVYTSSLDATVRLWDYRAGTELRRLEVREPVKHMVVQKELGVAYFSVQTREGSGRVMLYNVRTGKFSGNALKTRSAGPLALSRMGTLAATFDRHSLFVWRTGVDVYQPLNLRHTKPYTCLAISADNSLIAAGDVSGRILIWRSFEHSVPSALRQGEHAGKAHPTKEPPLTTVHWHAHPVGALVFSEDGTYLLSGGEEGVLVLWHLETNRRSYLPRLGGPILGLHLSPVDPAKYLARMANNVVCVINTATMKVETMVLGIKLAPHVPMLPPAGVNGGAVAVLPAGSAAALGGGSGGGGVLVLSCDNAELQFYDIARDQHLKLMQVVPRNAISSTESTMSPAAAGSGGGGGGPAPPAPFVVLLALSPDGSVLATVDVRPDAGPYGSTEACLKFWDSAALLKSGSGSNPKGGAPFMLNTRVDEPHRDVVTSLVYHPCRHMVVTTGGSGLDSEFKVWIQEGQRPEAATGVHPITAAITTAATRWRCRSIGGYKSLPMTAAAFSADGSVLAVAAAARVTLWDAESNALVAVLPAAAAGPAAVVGPTAATPLTQLLFIPGTPFLVSSSATCLAVYNLLTATLHWCLPLHAMSISADAAYGLLAVAIPVIAEEARQQQPQQQQHQGVAPAAAQQQAPKIKAAAQQRPVPRSCHVVVFDPRDSTPRYHCHVPGAARVHLTHLPAPAAAAGGSSGSGEGAEGCSPLLILRDSRQYSLAAVPGSKALLNPAKSQGGALESDPALSAFEAAFGKPMVPDKASGAAAPMDTDVPAGAATVPAVGGRPRWADLFDAPSHALPPPTALADSFLKLLTSTDV
ncbi:hypothetical protein VaNZ11_016768 [Volvox africanus]|uniref:WD repeat-containing protein 75 second beta-propeller domain-containing protein n=1 Tax=Volvox africanus TaxID=51714 RepID=A0ABQ5SPI4_9CHLO|nr:hypothetical protein VaNZ11_016768 [Volvox africanus]